MYRPNDLVSVVFSCLFFSFLFLFTESSHSYRSDDSVSTHNFSNAVSWGWGVAIVALVD